MATVHLIHGFVGTGKTTFSKKLESENQNIIRFTLDEWMIALFGKNPPKEAFGDFEKKLKALIWGVAQKNLALGNDVILDFGFWKKNDRDDYKKMAKDVGAEVKLYNLRCPDDVILERVLKRTEEMGDGALFIDENAINEFKQYFEPVNSDTEESILIETA
jgi:predicted kinase